MQLARTTSITFALLLCSALAYSESDTDTGRDIYRSALGAGGQPIVAVVQNDVPLPAVAAACANCHRRSGLGISEGGSRSLNITGPALFNATEKPPIRPAYDEQTLIRAIVAGVSVDGRQLHATMPRYQLDAENAHALAAYLKSLAASPPDGVGDNDITIATVVSHDAPAAERDAVVAVLQRFVELKNGESRNETRRAAASERHYYGRNKQRAHRQWRLVVWELSGAPASWTRQLQRHYDGSKPFAIVSGTTGNNWLPVHDFCEDREIPCILPLSPAPAAADQDFYSLYFSSGPVLEAQVTAKHLLSLGLPVETRVSVLHRDDAASAAAFAALQEQLALQGLANTEATVAKGRKPVSARKWRKLLKKQAPDVLISWLDADSVALLAVDSIPASSLPEHIYTSSSFTDWVNSSFDIGRISDRIRHVYPYSLPSSTTTQFPREYLWLKHQGLAHLDAVAASRVLYTCRVLGMGLADIQTSFSREFFLEALEHALDGTQLTSVYPRTSLGPDQRLLTRGAYVVDLSAIDEGRFANPVWLQP